MRHRLNKDPSYQLAWESPKTRIVQYNKRRYALRLERVYWDQLEQLADKRGQRLGRIVADLAAHYTGVNLSSYLRSFCMAEAQRDLARYRLTAGAFDLVSLLRGCPAPAILLDEKRTILDTNQALLSWLGNPPPALRQAFFDTLFQPRVTRPLDETFRLMQEKKLQRTQIHVTFTNAQGQTRSTQATLTALPVGHYFYCLVWLGK